ncbi:MAG: hypothetical protein WCJ17_00755 [bacterium]
MKIIQKLFIGVLCCTLFKTLSPLICISHGSFGSESSWFRPGGMFYEAVKKEALTRGEPVTPWIWSGGVSEQNIIEAAGTLVEYILQLPPQTPISFIAHSNGGNVCAYATMILASLYASPQQTSTFETDANNMLKDQERPTETLPHPASLLDDEETDEAIPPLLRFPFLHQKLTKHRTYRYEMHPQTEQVLQTTLKRVRGIMQHSVRLHRAPNSYPISLLCSMGTPIDSTRFDIDMRIVRQAINIYSPADVIQSLVGKQLIPQHERRANVQARIHDITLHPQPIDPCHKKVHHVTIGKWILHLPDLLADTNENAAPYQLHSGIITFFPDKEPEITRTSYSELSASLTAMELESSSCEEEDVDDECADDEWCIF